MKYLLMLSLLLSCGGESEDDRVTINFVNSIEASITAMAGIQDEQVDEGFALSEPSFIDKLLYNLNPISCVYAAPCGRRAFSEICTGSQERISTFSDCTLGTTGIRFDGTVSLEYSEAGCQVDDGGEEVTRTFNYTKSGDFGSIRMNSSNHEDYRETLIGGGEKLTYLGANEYNLDIMGKRKTAYYDNGSIKFDLSVRTTANIAVTGGIARGGRILDGGRLEAINNTDQYVLEFEPIEVTYSDSCCYPISGSMDLIYTGSRSGTGLVTFNGCGSGSVTFNGEVKEIDFYSCE